MPVTSVIGGQWGDEGKGKIVDFLCKDIDVVARYQGGANAGHTVYVNNNKVILHQIPSGIFRENCHCILGNGMVVDPVGLEEELNVIRKLKLKIKNRIHIAYNAHIVTPFHKMIDLLNESNLKKKIGTTLKGIGPAYVDKYNRNGIIAYDLLNIDQLEKKMYFIYNQFQLKYKLTSKQLKALEKDIKVFINSCDMINCFINDTFDFLNQKYNNDSQILIEGAQGTMLDIDHGTYPYVTSSSPSVGGISVGLGFPANRIKNNIGIFKAYTTRVGGGPFPTESFDEYGQKLRELGSEYGSTTGRARRCGWFDAVSAGYSCQLNGFTSIALTKLDVLDNFDTILICTKYKKDTMEYNSYSETKYFLEEVNPIYERFPGWKTSTEGIINFSELPENAKKYILLISRLLKTPINLISTGPKRNQIISI